MKQTKTQQLLLEAVAAALRGACVTWETVSEEDFEALMLLSMQHKLQPLVLEAVYNCPAAAQWQKLTAYRQLAKQQTVSQICRTAEFQAVYQAFLDKGKRPLVVKGILCREQYLNGDLRLSADEDLLATQAEFEACCEVLRACGMEPDGEITEKTQELSWRKKGSALHIELHRSLIVNKSAAAGMLAALLSQVEDRTQAYVLNCGFTVYSLLPHDHLLYLLLHAYKHFIRSGFGIRQVADIGLWAQRYRKQIDWELLYAQCSEVNALRFAAAVLHIAKQQLGIMLDLPLNWRQIEVDTQPMLLDLLNAGIYGSASSARTHSASVTLNAVSAQHKSRRSSLLQTVFPPKKALEQQYPVLKKHGIVLPYVWTKRLLTYRKNTKNSGGATAAETIKLAQERKKLLKLYGILSKP